ncbi:MAG TPA: hypothetical protein VF595_05960 [Tepidisphaeraceae bacterium]|jgi:hypothetical protein
MFPRSNVSGWHTATILYNAEITNIEQHYVSFRIDGQTTECGAQVTYAVLPKDLKRGKKYRIKISVDRHIIDAMEEIL